MIARFVAAVVVGTGMFALTPAAHAQRGDRDSIECTSSDYRFNRCGGDGWRDARLVRQTSGSECIRGRSWGVDRQGLWVDKGCAGVFVEAGRGGGGGGGDYGGGGGGGGDWRPGAGWDQDIHVRCASQDYHYNMCQVDVGRGGRVYIDRQISGTRCVEGRNWGSNRAGVWVDQGCEAVFVVERRWR